MDKALIEFLLMGVSFILAPIVACLVSVPFFDSERPIVPVVLGTISGMSVYVGAYFLSRKIRRSPDEDSSKRSDRKRRGNEPISVNVDSTSSEIEAIEEEVQ